MTLAHTPDTLAAHLAGVVAATPLESEPFCHFYTAQFFPPDMYAAILANLPAPGLYSPINLKKWARADGTSTRDQCYLTPATMARMPSGGASLWSTIADAASSDTFKRAVFAKLAPDMAERFGRPAGEVPALECTCEVVLNRDTEDYRIKPHPDGLNKYVTLQAYLPADAAMVDLGTALYRRRRGLVGDRFEEVKRFPFLPNSAYAFAVLENGERTSWHGRETLSGFKGVRNSLMVLFQRVSNYAYA